MFRAIFSVISCFLKTIAEIVKDSLRDESGHYSHARIIAMLVAFGATVFMWKLIIAGGMTIEYFFGYLAYGTGHQTLNKFLDRKSQNASTISENGNTPEQK
jgi:hypothetical protein